MAPASMTLDVLLPFQVFISAEAVTRVVAETRAGAFGLLPRRRDCVAALVPGIVTYETPGDGEVFLAVDGGVMVKTGPRVLVSVRRAIRSANLAELRSRIRDEFLVLDQREEEVRTAMTKLETGFLRRLARLRHE